MLGTFDKIVLKIKSQRHAYLSTPCVVFRGWFVFVSYVFKIQLSFCHVVSVSLLHQCLFIRSSFHEVTTCAMLYLVQRRQRSSNREASSVLLEVAAAIPKTANKV